MGPPVGETAVQSSVAFEFGLPRADAEDACKYEYVATDHEDSAVFPWSALKHDGGARPDFTRFYHVTPPQELHIAATRFWNDGHVPAAIFDTEMPDFGRAIRTSCPTEDDEFKYYATGGEDDEATSRWASRSDGSRRAVQRRRRRRSGCVKIAQCLIALDRVEDPRRILRISRTRLLGCNAQWLLTSHLEAQHGCVSMILAGNKEQMQAPGMFFVVMARAEDAQAILAGAEERKLAIGNVDVRVRSFKRSSEA